MASRHLRRTPHVTQSEWMSNDEQITALVYRLLSQYSAGSREEDAATVHVQKVRRLADLWAGYGSVQQVHIEIARASRDGENGSTRSASGEQRSLILKHISPPPSASSSSGGGDGEIDESRARKLLSYHVECNFYAQSTLGQSLVHSERRDCAIAKLYGCATLRRGWSGTAVQVVPAKQLEEDEEPHVALLLSDLRMDGYPALAEESRGVLNEAQIDAAIRWLAHFHAHFWGYEPESPACAPPLLVAQHGWSGEGVWEIGGYSYLATRQQEHANISRSSPFYAGLGPSSRLAFAVEYALQKSDHPARTLLHGDVKSANMAFSSADRSGAVRAAMYDFQYVGSGLGVSDLAKFLTTSVPSKALEGDGEQRLLRRYHTYLCAALVSHPCWRGTPAYASEKAAADSYPLVRLQEDWKAALCSWTRFQAGWGFWGNVSWLQNRVKGILQDSAWVDACVASWKDAGRPSVGCRRDLAKCG